MRIWTQQPDSPARAKVYHSGRFIKSVYSKTIFYRFVPVDQEMWPCNGHIILTINK